MNDAEWEEAVDMMDSEDIDILDWHYQEECKDEELEELYENLDFYSEWIDELEELVSEKDSKIAELEEKLEHQRKVILSLRNKNSQLIGDIRELLDDKEYEWRHSC